MNSKWHIRAVCKCGYSCESYFGFLSSVEGCCPQCGANPPDGIRYDFGGNWELKVMRYEIRSKWWNPLTWFTGVWITKEDK